MPITVHIKGLDDVLGELRKVEPEAKRAVANVLREKARAIRDDAKRRCPKDTGALSESVRYAVSRRTLTASVHAGGKKVRGIDTYYAHFVEYGTQKMRARPFLIPAGRAHEDETLEALTDALYKVLGG